MAKKKTRLPLKKALVPHINSFQEAVNRATGAPEAASGGRVREATAPPTERSRRSLQKLFHKAFVFIDERGTVYTRDQVIESTLHGNTSFKEGGKKEVVLADSFCGGQMVREVSTMKMEGSFLEPETGVARSVTGIYLFHSTYVRTDDGELQLLSTAVSVQATPTNPRGS